MPPAPFGILSSGNSLAPAPPQRATSATAKIAAAKILTYALHFFQILSIHSWLRSRLGSRRVDHVAAVRQPFELPASLDDALCTGRPHDGAGKLAQLVLQVAVAHRPFQVAEGVLHMSSQLGAVFEDDAHEGLVGSD